MDRHQKQSRSPQGLNKKGQIQPLRASLSPRERRGRARHRPCTCATPPGSKMGVAVCPGVVAALNPRLRRLNPHGFLGAATRLSVSAQRLSHFRSPQSGEGRDPGQGSQAAEPRVYRPVDTEAPSLHRTPGRGATYLTSRERSSSLRSAEGGAKAAEAVGLDARQPP